MQLPWWNMYPQSEFDNYKMQVDLLQEKLKRSEENRQQLEQELKQILQKRNEHDKSVRNKMRQKYQSFVDEQQRRNERNQMLIQMLERIDQQSAALSARSERLKMMKLQYERYFAKLMQTQATLCMGDMPAFPPAASAAAAPVAPTPTPMPMLGSHPTIPVLVPATQQPPLAFAEQESCATAATLTPRMWTLAMATPTQAGLLLTNANVATPTGMVTSTEVGTTAGVGMEASAGMVQPRNISVAGAGCDYLTYPLGYMNIMQQQQQQQQQPLLSFFAPATPTKTLDNNRFMFSNRPNANLSENTNFSHDRDRSGALNSFQALQDAIRASSNLNADAAPLPQQLAATQYGNGNAVIDASIAPEMANSNGATTNILPGQTTSTVAIVTPSPTTNIASAKLTFDKLPGALTIDSCAPIDATDVAIPSGSSGNSTGPLNNASRIIDATEITHKTHKTPEVEGDEKQPKHLENAQLSDKPQKREGAGTDTANSRHPMGQWSGSGNDAWQLESKEWHTPGHEMEKLAEMIGARNDQRNDDNPRDAMPISASGLAGFAQSSFSHAKVSAEPTSPQALAGNQSWQSMRPTTAAATAAVSSISSAPKMSIENIENAIYGELVTPTPIAADSNSKTQPTTILGDSAAHGFFEELVGQHQRPSDAGTYQMAQQQEEAQAPPAPLMTALESGNMAATDAIENATNQQPSYVYGAASATANEAYASNYDSQMYGTAEGYDDTVAATDGTINNQAQPQELEAVQPDYTQLDYGNYDATQYGNYDPNAYPGYTYNEATGQYDVTDPQYATEDTNAVDTNENIQLYTEPQQQLEGYMQDQQQEQQQDENNFDYSTEAYASNDALENSYQRDAEPQSASNTPAIEEQMAADATTTQAEPASATPPKPLKPTSILSSADRHAAANDANKKKKRVNFVDSSETDDSSAGKAPNVGGASSESDFDFSNSAAEAGK